MSNKMLNRYMTDRETKVKFLERMLEEAEDTGADLTDEQVQQRSDTADEIKSLDARIESLTVDLEIAGDLARKVAQVGRVGDTTDFQYRSAGAAVWDLLHQRDDDAKRRWKLAQVNTRAAEHMGTLAANTTATAGDLGGLHVVPNVGAIVDPYPGGMPFLSALGMQRIPSAAFSRPYIVDAAFDTGVAVQAKEKAELASKAFNVASDTLSAATYGGYLNVSQQLIEFQAGSLSIIIGHLRKRLANALEAAALTEVALTTGSETLAADADAATTLAAIYGASAKVMDATREPATWILMGTAGFARLGSLADLAGRPLFPSLGAANAPGTATTGGFTSTVAGLRPVVTWGITDGSIYVGNGAGFEAWYYPLPLLEAVEPSVLGRQVAVAAMLAPYRPTPNADSVIKLAP